jgi:hypothetical protein
MSWRCPADLILNVGSDNARVVGVVTDAGPRGVSRPRSKIIHTKGWEETLRDANAPTARELGEDEARRRREE